MVFSSLTFLFLFLPAVLLAYYIVPKQLKNVTLFLASLLFYAWGEPIYVCLMIFSTILDYSCGRLVDKFRGTSKQKIGLLLSISVNIGLLMFFKYTDFFIGIINDLLGTGIPLLNLPLPIGISFYTFQTMSYTIDVYRGEAKVQKNILSFGAYVSLFPQLIAGPIVRYQDIANQLDVRTHSFDKFGDGAKRFVIGLSKKVLLANNIGMFWKMIFESPYSEITAVGAWFGLISYGFQIYFDFSGYSDMAIGLGKMFGFDFLENFNYPYVSKSVTEFWHRWHISLGTWFRDYVYIPLGGNKKGLPIQIRNIAIVWMLTGFWHGASLNFVLWGTFFGVFLVLEKLFLLQYLKKIPGYFSHLYTIIVVLFSWVLFAFEDISQGRDFVKAMFGCGAGFMSNETLYYILSYLPMFVICLISSTPLTKKIKARMYAKCSNFTLLVSELVALLGLSFISLSYLISGSYNPFLYFRF